MVIEPGEDFDVGAAGEAVVCEVGLPGFVGLFCLEPDVGGAGFLFRFGGDDACVAEVAVDGGGGDPDVVVVFEVPGDGVAAGVVAVGGEFVAEADDEADGVGRGGVRAGFGAPGPGLERGVAFLVVPGDEFGDPAFGDFVVAGDLGLGAAFEDDCGDDQAGFGHPLRVSYVSTDGFPMSWETTPPRPRFRIVPRMMWLSRSRRATHLPHLARATRMEGQ